MALPIAVLVSGSGSNLQAIIDRIEAGALDAEVKVVISNQPGAYGLERADKHGIPTRLIPHDEYESRAAFDLALMRVINNSGAEVVVLAGFMRLLTAAFLHSFPSRVVNIHPALLPSFPGVHGQPDAAAYGVKVSGCTVHFVDEEMDHGPVIIQAAVPAYPDDDGDSLGARILKLEHRIYPQALHWLSQGRLAIKGRKVELKPFGGGKGLSTGSLLSLDEVRARVGVCLQSGFTRASMAAMAGAPESVFEDFLAGREVTAQAFVGIHNSLFPVVRGQDSGCLVNPPLEAGF